jgi:diacylglycerol O-acyltransferase-1
VCFVAAFFVSAVFHEILVAIPVHVTDQYLAFFGMMGQVPLVFATEFLEKWRHRWYKKYRGVKKADGTIDVEMPKNSLIGNLFFWISFCVVGQPFSVLLYYRAWLKNHS